MDAEPLYDEDAVVGVSAGGVRYYTKRWRCPDCGQWSDTNHPFDAVVGTPEHVCA